MKNTKHIFQILVYALFCINTLLSQNIIKGYVKDEKNQTLPGVVVYIPSINKNTITNVDGYFEISNVRNGSYIVEFRLLGYKTISQKVNVQSNEVNLNIQMPVSAREIDEVVITSAADASEQKDNPLPIKSIQFSQINEDPSNNIIEAIGKKENVWALSTGQGIAKPIIRGLGYNRTLVLVNGLRQEGQQWGDEHGVEIDQYSIEKAEIIKGPGSILFGSDALAGVVNFIPYKVSQDGFHGKYLCLYQNNNNMIANSVLLQYRKNDISFYIQGTQKDAGNYSNKIDGKVFNTGFNERNLSAMFQVNKNWGYTQFFASAFHQKLNMPEGDRDSSGRFLKLVAINDSTIGDEPVSDDDLSGYKFFIPYQKIKHYRFQNISAFNLKNTDKIITNIGYQYNIRDEFGPDKLIEKPRDEEEENRGELSVHLHTIPYQLRYIKNIDSSQFVSIGSTGMYQKNINLGDELLIPDYNLIDAGVFVFYQKSLKNIVFSGGVRWDIRSINSAEMYVDSAGKRIEEGFVIPNNAKLKFSAFSNNYNNFSGTAGMVYSGWKDVLLKLNIARGFRTPNPAELSSNGAHEGTVRYEYGNNKLKQEVSYQADLGFILNKEHILLEVSPFFNYIQNYIFYRRLSSQMGGDSVIVKDGENLWAYKFDQTNDAVIYGGELNIDIHPHPLDFLHFESNFSYLQGKFLNATDSTQYLPFFPPSRWTNGIRLEWNNLSSSIKRFFVNAEAMYVFPQNNYYKAFNTETYTPDYTLINFSAGLGWKYYKNNTMTLIAGVNNLLDEAYMSHLNRLKYVRPNPLTGKGIYNMGRNIFVRLIIDFYFLIPRIARIFKNYIKTN